MLEALRFAAVLRKPPEKIKEHNHVPRSDALEAVHLYFCEKLPILGPSNPQPPPHYTGFSEELPAELTATSLGLDHS